jgi:hypothetical protein
MKYGVALLNPSSRHVFNELANRNVIEEDYRTVPPTSTDNVVKYIILMTDGRTTDQSRPRVPTDGATTSGDRRDWNYNDIYSEFQPPDGGLHAMPSVVLTGDSVGGLPELA